MPFRPALVDLLNEAARQSFFDSITFHCSLLNFQFQCVHAPRFAVVARLTQVCRRPPQSATVADRYSRAS